MLDTKEQVHFIPHIFFINTPKFERYPFANSCIIQLRIFTRQPLAKASQTQNQYGGFTAHAWPDPNLSEIDSHWSRQVTCASLDMNWPAAPRNFTDGDFLILDGHRQIFVRKKLVAKIFFSNFSANLRILSRFIIVTCRKIPISD